MSNKKKITFAKHTPAGFAADKKSGDKKAGRVIHNGSDFPLFRRKLSAPKVRAEQKCLCPEKSDFHVFLNLLSTILILLCGLSQGYSCGPVPGLFWQSPGPRACFQRSPDSMTAISIRRIGCDAPSRPSSPLSRFVTSYLPCPCPPRTWSQPLVPLQTRLLQLGVLVCLAVWAELSQAKLLGVSE